MQNNVKNAEKCRTVQELENIEYNVEKCVASM
jgi:hypothetical protein